MIILINMKTDLIMSDHSIIALRVSNLIRITIEEDNQAGLAARELQILEHITRESSLQKLVFMEDGISLKHLGSRYTLRKSIQVLLDQGYISIDATGDSRQRPLIPAPRTLRLFDTIGKRIASELPAQQLP